MPITSNQSDASIVGTVDVNLTQADDSVVVYGNDGTTNRALKTDASGILQIGDGAGSLTVDNAGTFAVQATIASGATNIAKAEDAASADADVGVPAMAVRKATPANTSGADGDYEFLQMSAGRLWASAIIDTALPAGTNLIGKTTSQFDNKSSCTLANVSNSASNFTVFSSNSDAVGRTITNDSSTTVYIKFGTTASTTSYIRKLVPDEYYEFPQPLYTGQVDAIATSATGTLRTGEW